MLRTSVYMDTEMNSVLKNTYMLLSMTLVFAALAAFIGTSISMGPIVYIATIIAGFACLFAIRAYKDSAAGIGFVFLFTGLEGFSLGPILQHYLQMPSGSFIIASSAVTTAVMFSALSGYVLVTKKNFAFLGGMLFMGLIGLIVVSLIGMFFNVPALHLTVSFIGILIFSGYVLYDTSAIIEGGETNYIMATTSLFLDILNIFMNMLRIVSFLTGNRN